MGFWERYHERRIDKLTRKHPEVSRSQIAYDYYSYRENGFAFVRRTSEDGTDLLYACNVMCVVDDSLPNRVRRFGNALFRTVFEE